MSDQRDTVRLGRRPFLQLGGLATGALAARPALAALDLMDRAIDTGVHRPRTLRVGLLRPSDGLYPARADQFETGLRLYLDAVARRTPGFSYQLASRDVPGGHRGAERAATELLDGERVELVVGTTSVEVAARLRHMFGARQRLLIAAHAGADAVAPRDRSPMVLHHTLGLWPASFTAARWAAQHLGRRAVIATSLYDSGYDSLAALRYGYEAGGGSVAQIHVSHVPPDEGDPAPIIEAIRRQNPDVVLAAYCGVAARDFLAAYRDAGFAGRIPLVATGFMVEEAVAPAPELVPAGTVSVMTWSRDLDRPQSRAFVGAFADRAGTAADAFGAHGFDVARLVVALSDRHEGALRGSGALQRSLDGLSAEGVGGTQLVRAKVNRVERSLYLRETEVGGGRVSNRVVRPLDPVGEEDAVVAPLHADLKTAWLNEYLCA